MRQLEPESIDQIAARVASSGPLLWSWAGLKVGGGPLQLFALRTTNSLKTDGLGTTDYGRAVFHREVVEPEVAAARIIAAQTGPADGVPVGLSWEKAPPDRRFGGSWLFTGGHRTTFGDPVDWPTYEVNWALTEKSDLIWQGKLHESLHRVGLDPYDSAAIAILRLIYETGPTVNVPQLMPEIVIALEDRRARLAPHIIKRSRLSVAVEEGAPGSAVNFHLQVGWEDASGPSSAEETISSSHVFAFRYKGKLGSYHTALIAPNDTVTDEADWKAPRPWQQPFPTGQPELSPVAIDPRLHILLAPWPTQGSLARLIGGAAGAIVTIGTLYEWARPGGMESAFQWLLQPRAELRTASFIVIALLWLGASLNNAAFLAWPVRHPAAARLATRVGRPTFVVPALPWWDVVLHACVRAAAFGVVALVLDATAQSVLSH